MAHQQLKPNKIGFPPRLIRVIIFVFKPIAAIAMTIKNLLNSFRGLHISGGKEKTVVRTDAKIKYKTKKGKTFLIL